MSVREITLFASASRVAATYNSEDQVTAFAKGVIVFLNITAITAGNVALKVQGRDIESGDYIDIPSASLANQSAAGLDMLTVYPGIAETANVSVSDRMPKYWRVVITVTTGPATFSVYAQALD